MVSRFKRTLLHIVFGVMALGLAAEIANVSSLHLSPEVEAVVTLVGTALASFFRGEEVNYG